MIAQVNGDTRTYRIVQTSDGLFAVVVEDIFKSDFRQIAACRHYEAAWAVIRLARL